MTTENEPTRNDPGAMLYGFAARAMQIYSIADMLAQHIESADEPGPACGMIADEAMKLNTELFDLAQKIKGMKRNGETDDDEAVEGKPAEPISDDDDPIGDEAAREYYAHRDREKAGNISRGSAYDDVLLRLERVDHLLLAITDAEMSGEARDLVSLASIARSEIAAAERVCQDNSKRWDAS